MDWRYRMLVETSRELIWTMDVAGVVTYVNAASHHLLGHAPEEVIGRHHEEFVTEADRPAVRAALSRAALEDRSLSFETVLERGDGTAVQALVSVVPNRLPSGGIEFGGSTTDISDLKRTQAELELAREQFAGAFDAAPVGMTILELDPERGGLLLQVNEAACAIAGLPAEAMIGRRLIDLGSELANGEIGLIRRMIAGDITTYVVEKRFRRVDGDVRDLRVHVSLVRNGADSAIAVQQIEDITESRAIAQRLRHLADHDPLTDLPNRHRLEEELHSHLALAQRYDEGGAVIVLDLDNFKYVNDMFGHRMGDHVIRVVANRLRGRARETDVLGRLAADEFTVLLPHADEFAARRAAEDLLAAIAEEPILLGTRRVHVTASVGIGLYRRTDFDQAEVLALAGVAMHQAKEVGPNSIVVCDVDSGRKATILRRAELAQRVREAIAGEGFELHAQPIVALGPDDQDREEVLLRLRDRDGTLVSAAEFIPAAEGFSLMTQLDRWVISASVAHIRRNQDAGISMVTHVNLSAQSLSDASMPCFISAAIEEHRVDATRIVFEVTETAAIDNIELAQGFLGQLRELGCGLALDDFGAGYGSFRHLKHLPFDVMKIDGDFIRDLPRSDTDLVMVRALVGAAAGLGKQVVAEYVSDDETIELLRGLGVDYAQGFHVGMPAPIPAASARGVRQP